MVPALEGSTAEFNDTVTFDQPDQELIVVLVPEDELLYLVNNLSEVCLWEFVGTLSHILCCELIGSQQLEVIHIQLDDASDLEISFSQIARLVFPSVFLSFQELATPYTRVFVGLLVNLDGIVSTEEVYDKLAFVVVLGL